MAPLVGIIGNLQAMEAIKLLANYGQLVSGRLLMYDAMTAEFRSITLAKDSLCAKSARVIEDRHYNEYIKLGQKYSPVE